MAFGRSTTHRASEWGLAAGMLVSPAALTAATGEPPPCDKPVYLTVDTGHMGVAEVFAQVIQRHQIKVTFFLANEATQTGGTSLDDTWAPWWRARAAEGHAFASHTWDHGYWRGDLPGQRLRIRQTFGPQANQQVTWSAAQYCEELRRPAQRLKAITGAEMLPLFRAPGGKTSSGLLAAARGCGFQHVGWSDAGFLGDELPSEAASNERLLAKALKEVRTGDVLLAHLGIWSRKDPWAPAVLEPLVRGLKAKGHCFATLRQHPDHGRWIAQRAASPQHTP